MKGLVLKETVGLALCWGLEGVKFKKKTINRELMKSSFYHKKNINQNLFMMGKWHYKYTNSRSGMALNKTNNTAISKVSKKENDSKKIFFYSNFWFFF